MSFEKLGLKKHFVKALEAQKIETPFPIQSEAIPAIFKGGDVVGIAPTGSGKTASYVLPLLQGIEKSSEKPNRHLNVLVLVPTRELAVQVQEVFYLFGKEMTPAIRSMAVFGGASINPQMKKLMGVKALVATPGRLLELLEKNAIHLNSLDAFVVDEADKMLNLGFKEEMDKIISKLPFRSQKILFSATLSPYIVELSANFLKAPQVINVAPEPERIDQITHRAFAINQEKKGPLLRKLIKNEKMKQVLIFASSTYKADHIAEKLWRNKIDSTSVHSKRSMQHRREALNDFKQSKLRTLVATDLLSRGIDIDFLPWVVNYELPRSPKDYIHRVGRTGRAHAPGTAISLVSPEEEHHFKVIQKKMKISVPLEDGEAFLDA